MGNWEGQSGKPCGTLSPWSGNCQKKPQPVSEAGKELVSTKPAFLSPLGGWKFPDAPVGKRQGSAGLQLHSKSESQFSECSDMSLKLRGKEKKPRLWV